MMSRLLSTVLKETVTFEAIAAQNPSQVNDVWAVVATAMPAMTNMRLPQAFRDGRSPMRQIVKSAVKRGSAALTVCVNDMCTSETDTFEKSIPIQCRTISGSIRFT
mmetsp:Transcript_22547/g.40706  ORF Transcript_22547/g.40706 Transcript_22547/m.40706 type:complete len:106 (+) Transcript_22547:390-707(+)